MLKSVTAKDVSHLPVAASENQDSTATGAKTALYDVLAMVLHEMRAPRLSSIKLQAGHGAFAAPILQDLVEVVDAGKVGAAGDATAGPAFVVVVAGGA